MSKYNCSQQELYNACRIAWGYCKDYMPDFSKFKAKYTEAYVSKMLSDIDAADWMPDDKARYAPYDALRVDLEALKTDVCDNYQRLKCYIDEAYPKDKRAIMYNAAGQPFYERAAQSNWASVTGLLSAALPFVTDNEAVLMENENMPEAFLTDLTELKTAFDTTYQSWLRADNNGSDGTVDKIDANDLIYEKAIIMLKDGQRLFVKSPELAKKFKWTNILTYVRGHKPSGLGLRVSDENTKDVIANATIAIAGISETFTTNDAGRCEIAHLNSGKYNLTITAEGYIPVIIEEYKVKVGVTGRLKVAMTAVMAANKVLTTV